MHCDAFQDGIADILLMMFFLAFNIANVISQTFTVKGESTIPLAMKFMVIQDMLY